MNDSKQQYRIADEQQRQRIQDFESCEDNTSRKGEIAACRALLEQAINSGSVSTANSLLGTLNSLQRNEFKRQMLESELITKPAVLRFGNRIVEIIATLAEQHFPGGWEDFLVDVSEGLDSAFDELRNDPKDLEGKLPR